jgi:hypothetical protein
MSAATLAALSAAIARECPPASMRSCVRWPRRGDGRLLIASGLGGRAAAVAPRTTVHDTDRPRRRAAAACRRCSLPAQARLSPAACACEYAVGAQRRVRSRLRRADIVCPACLPHACSLACLHCCLCMLRADVCGASVHIGMCKEGGNGAWYALHRSDEAVFAALTRRQQIAVQNRRARLTSNPFYDECRMVPALPPDCPHLPTAYAAARPLAVQRLGAPLCRPVVKSAAKDSMLRQSTTSVQAGRSVCVRVCARACLGGAGSGGRPRFHGLTRRRFGVLSVLYTW